MTLNIEEKEERQPVPLEFEEVGQGTMDKLLEIIWELKLLQWSTFL